MTEFIGFPRPDGSVGIRNHVLLIGLDQAGVNLCHKVAGVAKGTLLVFSGPEGGGVLSEVVRHPNAAGSVVVGEGIEEPDKDSLISDLERSGKPHGVIDIDGLGFMEAMTKATQAAIHIVQDVSTHRRELVKFSKLLPVLFHTPDDLRVEVLVGFLRLLMEENGRCLWVEKGAKGGKVMNPEIKKALAGDVKIGQAPGADPGVYRYTGPVSERGILKTVLGSGAQVMAFPAGPRRFMANALIPGVSFSVGQDLGSDQICDLDLGQKVDKELSTEETGLLLFSEILATASGKLTGDEVLGDVLII
jgi:altronate dehydratase large subunit